MDEITQKGDAARAHTGPGPRLLAPDEPPAVSVHRPEGDSDFFITCDHAGNMIPRRLGALGLEPLHLARHIAWDVGASGLSRRLSALLDATVVTQTYSRLVIDCNRALTRPDSIATMSEDTEIPGNLNLDPAEAEGRAREIFLPYHDAIAKALDARDGAGRHRRAHRHAQLHARLPRRLPTLAHRPALQPRCAAGGYSQDPHGRRPSAVYRRQPALHDQRRERLHDPGARRATRHSARRDLDAPRPDRGC